MTVLECLPESIIVRVHNDHLLEERKNMNLPGMLLVLQQSLLCDFELKLKYLSNGRSGYSDTRYH